MHAAQLTVVFDQPFFENGSCHSPLHVHHDMAHQYYSIMYVPVYAGVLS